MPKPKTSSGKPRRRGWLRRVVLLCLLIPVGAYGLCVLGMLYLRFFRPVTTAVQVERRVQSWFSKGSYHKESEWVPLNRISPQLQHAVIAAEDSRFYQHNGIDWEEVDQVIEASRKKGTLTRGASTLSQQLVKNLFLTTEGSIFRKFAEYALVPAEELILGKQRILELYLNVVEWGPGVYGAEAAARYHYHSSAARLNRDQASRLAAVLPSPRRRRPARMNSYAAIIQERMDLMGW